MAAVLTRVLAGLCLALLLAVLGLSWYAKGATERAAQASGQAEGYRVALEAQNAELAAYGDRLMAREAERAQAARQAAEWRRKWRAALNDQQTADWAAGPLPDRVRELSRSHPDQPAPDRSPATADPAAVLRPTDQR